MMSTSVVTGSGTASPLDDASVPVICSHASSVQVEDRNFVYDERQHTIMVLNPTAAAIWSLCDGTRKIAELAEDLAGAFEMDIGRVRSDLVATVAKLVELGLMRIATGPPDG
jgi:aspartate-semialdehyde dehydrogenase